MLNPTIHILFITLSTYTALLALALFVGGGFALYRAPAENRLQVFDVLIGGLVGGIIIARAEHVLLNLAHFSFHRGEIAQIQAGGLDWHGALVGAALGMVLVSRWHKLALLPIIDSLTLLPPLLALALWWGCWSASCGYGLEVATLVDYPAWLVWEGRDIFGTDAPRFRTQWLGMVSSGIVLMMALVLFWQKRLVYRRFWLVIMLIAASLFFISFLQGGHHLRVNQLRVSQYLDGIVFFYALYLVLRRAGSS